MPRYFFHVHNSFGIACDDEGQDAASLADAREIAVNVIRHILTEILTEELRSGRLDMRGRINIEDQAGSICMTVPFAEAVDLRTDEAMCA